MVQISLIFFAVNALLSVTAQNYRLPVTVIPISYDVTITPNLTTFTFTGSVSISVRATQAATDTITLHSKDLVVSNVRLTNSIPSVTGYDYVTETDFLVVSLNQSLIANQNYILAMNFAGTLGTENVGLYRASYVDEEDNERHLAITHFESTNARRAFPCFDEINLKATFRLRLVRDPEYITTANTYLESSLEDAEDQSKIVDTYVPSFQMSTYLVAFSVSLYSRIFQGTYAVYGRKELLDRGEGNYSLAIGRGAIEAMEAYTSVNYNLMKMDQFAVPNDYYKIGAMENWGMVTYRERYLMYNPDTSTTSEKQNTATIIAHEFAHQWFGDLVTPQWWKYIWLNEGFATFFEMVIADQLEPDWKLMDQFVTSVMQPAFNVDGFVTSTSMTKDAESPSEIESLYDTIVYNKAGSVIRMAAAFLGEEAFKAGLTYYLNEWSLLNVEPANLYSSWQIALNDDNINVAEIMESWETQKGYPVVTVTRNGLNGNIRLTQERFLLRRAPDDDVATVWHVPLNFMYSELDDFDFSDTSPDRWLTTASENITGRTRLGFVIVNKRQTGYYRVNYDATSWTGIIEFLRNEDFTKIDLVNRAQLVDDAFNLARGGQTPYETALSLGAYLGREREYVPLASFFNALRYLHPILAQSEGYENFKTYVFLQLEAVAEQLNFEAGLNDEHSVRLNRINVMTWLCDLGLGECRRNALASLRAWRTNPIDAVRPDEQLYVYCGALREGDQTDVDFLIEKYQTEKSDTHRTRILNSLGCSQDADVLTRLLTMTLDNQASFYKPADRQTAFASVYNSGSFGLSVAFDYVKNYSPEISASDLSLSTILTGISTKLSTQQQLIEFSVMLELLDEAIPEATLAAAIKNVADNVDWSSNFVPVINNWLYDYVNPNESTSSIPETTTIGASSVVASLVLLILGYLLVSLA